MHPQPSLMSCQSFKVNEMAERYKQLLKTGMQYQKDCPVLLAASALLLDTQTQHVCAQLKLQSLVSKSISAVNVMLECFDPAGLTVLCHEEYWFRDLTDLAPRNRASYNVRKKSDLLPKKVVHLKREEMIN